MIENYIKPAFYSKSFFSIGVLCFNLKNDDLIIKLRQLYSISLQSSPLGEGCGDASEGSFALSLVPSLVDVSPVLLTKKHVRYPFSDN